jgi:hypothetical protein
MLLVAHFLAFIIFIPAGAENENKVRYSWSISAPSDPFL